MKLSEEQAYSTKEPITSFTSEDLPTPHNEAGKFLKEKRMEKGLSLRGLASKANISYAELSRIENGKAFPTPYTLKKLCPFLSIPWNDLLSAFAYSYRAEDNNEPIYLDLHGNEVDLSKKSKRLYDIDVELFFLLDEWLDNYTSESAEQISQLLLNLLTESSLNKQKPDKKMLTENDSCFLNLMDSMRGIFRASKFFTCKTNGPKQKGGNTCR